VQLLMMQLLQLLGNIGSKQGQVYETCLPLEQMKSSYACTVFVLGVKYQIKGMTVLALLDHTQHSLLAN
jgi:hypothetical protein